jgi:hypothetical protein
MGAATDTLTLPLMFNDQNIKRCYNSAQGNSTQGRVSTAVVHLICNQGVGGSNPSPGTIFKETA